MKAFSPTPSEPTRRPVLLAFLQNQWFNEPQRVQKVFERYPEQRRDLIREFLFMGCRSGRNLLKAFGKELCSHHIVWEEVSPEIGGYSASVFPPDPDHIQNTLDEVQPDLVLLFGRIPERGVLPLWKGPHLIGPHPTARGKDTQALLSRMSRELQTYLSQAETLRLPPEDTRLPL